MRFKLFSICLTGAVIVLFCGYNWFFSVNFPYQDDFLLIQFIEVVSKDGIGGWDFIKELFRTFNDHKAVVPRLIAFADYKLTGYLNFRFYLALVSLNIVSIFGFLYIQFSKIRLPIQYFLPAPFLFFHPLYHDISGWALNGMQHSFLTMFTLAAIILVSRRSNAAFLAGIFCCFLATFTHGNGILSFPAVFFFLICVKKVRRAALTVGFMLVCLGIYVAGYESGQAVNLPTSAGMFISSFFGLIGSQMSIWSAPVLWSVLWGIIIIGLLIFGIFEIGKTYFDKKRLVRPGVAELLAVLAFVAATSFVIALFRSWSGNTMASRFQIYAALSTVVVYILLVGRLPFFQKKSVLYVITGLSVFYAACSYQKFTGIVATKKTTYLADIYNWTENRKMFSVEHSIVRNAGFYLFPAYKKGFFRLSQPVVSSRELDSLFVTSGIAKRPSDAYIEPWKMQRMGRDSAEELTHYFISSNLFPGEKSVLDDRFLALKHKDDGTTYLIGANPKVGARRDFLTGGGYYQPGFHVFLRSDDLDPGSYSLAILDVKLDGEIVFNKLDKDILAEDGGYFLE